MDCVKMPIFGGLFLIIVLGSAGLPGLSGFVGEFLTLLGAFTAGDLLGWKYAAVAGIGLILGAIYILYMVGKVVWGPVKVPADHGEGGHEGDHGQSTPPRVHDLNLREIVVLLPLALGCLWLGVYPKPVLTSLEAPVTQIVEHVRHRQTTDLADAPGTTRIIVNPHRMTPPPHEETRGTPHADE